MTNYQQRIIELEMAARGMVARVQGTKIALEHRDLGEEFILDTLANLDRGQVQLCQAINEFKAATIKEGLCVGVEQKASR